MPEQYPSRRTVTRAPAKRPETIASAGVITVVGIGTDGWHALSPQARACVEGAGLVLGGSHPLALLPDIPGQRREPWPSPLHEGLRALLASVPPGREVVALASGDPLLSGVASTLVDLLGPQAVHVVPTVSSVSLARAVMRWPAHSCAVVAMSGGDTSVVRRELAPGRRVLVLSSDEHTPVALAELLVETGYGDSALTVLGHLGGPRQSAQRFDAAWLLTTEERSFPRLNVVALELSGPHRGGWVPGLPDDAFENDGRLTTRDLRAVALARLAPTPGELLWDIGAGSGSVGIEWMRAHHSCAAVAVEPDPVRAERIVRNAAALGVPGLKVVNAPAPEALLGLPGPPDAIFVGGGATLPGVVEGCLTVLRDGGRLVVQGSTLETEHLLGTLHHRHGGDLTRLSVETTVRLGATTGWAPSPTVTQWTWWA